MSELSLLGIFAHPDDESLGTGHVYAKYAAEGVRTHLITATRGQRGWAGPPEQQPDLEALGKLREAELRAAAGALGIGEVILLDYMDGELDRADPARIIPELAAHIRRIHPQVIMTFDQNGAYGHPDHIAICQFSHAAAVAAADPTFAAGSDAPPHRVSKFYYLSDPESLLGSYEALFGELVMEVDGVNRYPELWNDWAITTRVDCEEYLDKVLDAIGCHRSQLRDYDAMRRDHRAALHDIFSTGSFFRVFSFVNGGRQPERDLFEGLRAIKR